MEFVPGQTLSEISKNDKPWEGHKVESTAIEGAYASDIRFLQYAARMRECANSLVFGTDADGDGLKLVKAHFCRVRYCPVCNWRKSLALKARFLTNLSVYLSEIVKYEFLHIVFTVKNPPMYELRDTIKNLNAAFKKLLKREVVLPVVKGYIKSIEVTKGKHDGKPHPHIHAIFAVNKSYFTDKTYIKQKSWVELWRSCLDVNYNPIVSVKKVKPKLGKKIKIKIPEEFESLAGLIAGVIEVSKYAVKPADVVDDEAFLFGITEQTKGMRFQETGGCFKGIFKNPRTKQDEFSEDELLMKSNDSNLTDKRLLFLWEQTAYFLRKIVTGD